MKYMHIEFDIAVPDDKNWEAAGGSFTDIPKYIMIHPGDGHPYIVVPDSAKIAAALPEGFYVGGDEGWAWKHQHGEWYSWNTEVCAWELFDSGELGSKPGQLDSIVDMATFRMLAPLDD